MINPINVVVIGGCSATDILRTDPNYDKFYNITEYRGSISKTYVPAGQLASRLYDTFYRVKIKPPTVKQQFEAIYKRDTPLSILKSLPKNYVLIIDISYELLSFYYDGKEYFDIFPDYEFNKKRFYEYYPQWFTEQVEKHRYWFDSGIRELAFEQSKNLKEFTKFASSLGVPGIIIGNLFTNRIYDKNTNSVVELLPKLVAKSLPFKNFKKALSYEAMYDYSNRVVSSLYEKMFRELPEHSVIFQPDKNLLFADPEHPYGYSPSHLHYTCRKTLLSDLRSLLFELGVKQQKWWGQQGSNLRQTD